MVGLRGALGGASVVELVKGIADAYGRILQLTDRLVMAAQALGPANGRFELWRSVLRMESSACGASASC